MSNLFTEEKYNALMQALEELDGEVDEDLKGFFRDVNIRNAREIVDKLEELGYLIVKK